jgi:RNA polymerase sigma-70 factor (ECF subfamily)
LSGNTSIVSAQAGGASSMANVDPVPDSKMLTATTESQPSPSADLDDDLALVGARKNGDIAAFEQLLKRYDHKLPRIAQNVTHEFTDAQKVVQEAFAQAYQKLNQFRETARFSTWLTGITLSELFINVRKLRPAKELLVEDLESESESLPSGMTNWAPNNEELCPTSELARILRKCLDELNPHLRVVFVLREIEELPINETAEVLNLTPIAVKARLIRARLHLRDRLSKYLQTARKNPSALILV